MENIYVIYSLSFWTHLSLKTGPTWRAKAARVRDKYLPFPIVAWKEEEKGNREHRKIALVSYHINIFKPIHKRKSHDFLYMDVWKTILTASPMRGKDPGRLGKCDQCLPIMDICMVLVIAWWHILVKNMLSSTICLPLVWSITMDTKSRRKNPVRSVQRNA